MIYLFYAVHVCGDLIHLIMFASRIFGIDFKSKSSAVQFYSTIMFRSAGMENPKLGTVIVGILKIFFTITTIFIMNRFRRKLLMQMSLGIDSTKYFY